MGEHVELTLDLVARPCLEEPPDPPVQRRPRRAGEAAVSDLLRDDVAELVADKRRVLDHHAPGPAQILEARLARVATAELGRDRGENRRLEAPPNRTRDLQRCARRLLDPV